MIFEFRAETFVEPDDRALFDQINEALEATFNADRADKERADGRRDDP